MSQPQDAASTGVESKGASSVQNRFDSRGKNDVSSRNDSSKSNNDTSGKRASHKESRPKQKTHRKRPILNFAPLNTPLKNRLETIGILWHTISIPFFICLFLGLISLGWVVWVSVILPYFIWWYGFDLHTPTNGKVVYRTRDWMRNLLIWEWFANYFPVRVHKMVELEPTFSEVLVEQESIPDDEEDLISEHSRTFLDTIFKKLGLSKRLNDVDSYSPPPSTHSDNDCAPGEDDDLVREKRLKSGSHLYKYKKVSTGPRYIFGYHPHGVISMGAMATFATNAIRNEPFEPPVKFLKPFFHDPSKGERLLPGIGYVFPLTLNTQFTLPFYRDYLLSLGLTSASAKNIKSLINNGDNSVCIVVGGAQESLLNNMVSGYTKVGNGYKGDQYDDNADDDKNDEENNHDKAGQGEDEVEEFPSSLSTEEADSSSSESKPSDKVTRQIRLVLNKRKGFVKLAIELGNVSLVPTFAFGEADIYKLSMPKPGSWGYAFQQWMKKKFHFTLPFFSARGVFIYDFGFLPYRNAINVVTGRPIHIPDGVLAEYKMKHPEFDPSRSSSDHPSTNEKVKPPSENNTLKRSSESFAALFKKKHQQTPVKAKTKVPQELLDHYHKLYVDELKRVYEENKHKFGYHDVELCIIE